MIANEKIIRKTIRMYVTLVFAHNYVTICHFDFCREIRNANEAIKIVLKKEVQT